MSPAKLNRVDQEAWGIKIGKKLGLSGADVLNQNRKRQLRNHAPFVHALFTQLYSKEVVACTCQLNAGHAANGSSAIMFCKVNYKLRGSPDWVLPKD